jgi:hypothetical protein
MIIAFDIDDTLLIPSVATGFGNDTPNYDTIAIYKWFQAQGNEMILWSGSGIDWATKWGEKLGLQPFEVRVKEIGTSIQEPDVDIAFDDCEVYLAKVNVRVKRLNNSISRKEWNANKTSSDKDILTPTSEGKDI